MKALVFGAGKIARGFVGQLLELSGWETTFVDINRELVQALNEKGTYTVHILGDPSLNTDVTHYRAIAAGCMRRRSGRRWGRPIWHLPP